MHKVMIVSVFQGHNMLTALWLVLQTGVKPQSGSHLHNAPTAQLERLLLWTKLCDKIRLILPETFSLTNQTATFSIKQL